MNKEKIRTQIFSSTVLAEKSDHGYNYLSEWPVEEFWNLFYIKINDTPWEVVKVLKGLSSLFVSNSLPGNFSANINSALGRCRSCHESRDIDSQNVALQLYPSRDSFYW